MVSPKSFVQYPDLYPQSRAPSQTAAKSRLRVLRPSKPKQFHSVTLHPGQELSSCSSPGVLGELWICRDTQSQAGSEPGCLNRHTHIFQGHPEAATQLSWCSRGQSRRRTYLWKQLCPEQLLHYCCTAGDGARDCPQQGLTPRQVTK